MEQGLASMMYGTGEGNTIKSAYGGVVTKPKVKDKTNKRKPNGK